jgi:hypothetical protein
MGKPFRSQRIIALVAAYVVALQALLLPLSVAAGVPFSSSICASSAESPQQPASHETGCPCAAGCGMQCCVQVLIGSPQAVMAMRLTYVRASAPAPAIEPVTRPAAKGPQIPRAPPAA